MKNIGLKSLLICIAACLVFASCSNDSQDGNAPQAYLPLEDVNKVHPLGDSFIVSYTSVGSWTLQNESEWIKVTDANNNSITGGKAGTTMLHITVLPNLDSSRRESLVFKSKGETDIEKEFIQDKAVLEMNSASSLRFGWVADATGKEIKVSSNIRWKMSVEGEDKDLYRIENHEEGTWLGKLGKEDEYEYKLTSLKHNMSSTDDERPVRVVIEPVKIDLEGSEVSLPDNVMDALSHTIEVSQDFLIFSLTDEDGNPFPTDLNFSELGDTATVNVVLEKGYEWECGWNSTSSMEVDPSKEDGREDIVKGRDVVIKPVNLYLSEVNPSREARNGYMDFWVNVGSDDDIKNSTKISIDVTQAPFVFEVSPRVYKVEESFENKGGEIEVTFSSSAEWEIINQPDWINVDQQDVTTVILSADQNLYFADDNYRGKTDDFAIKSRLNDLTIPLNLSQKPFIFDVVYDLEGAVADPTQGIARNDTTEYVIKLTTSGPWRLDSKSDWIKVSKNEGDGDAEVTLTASEYDNLELDDSRNGDLVFTSLTHEESGQDWGANAEKSLKFIQESLRFSIERSMNDPSVFEPSAFDAYKGSNGVEESGNQSFYLRCSADWTVSSDSEWLSVDRKSGSGYTTVTLSAATNPSVAAAGRDAEVTVIAKVGDRNMPKTFKVHQNPFKFEVKTTDDATYNPWNPASHPVQVTTTGNAPWEISISDTDDIIKTESSTKYGSVDNFCIELNNNKSERNKSAQFTIKSKVAGTDAQPKTFTINQEGYKFDVKVRNVFNFTEIKSNSKYDNSEYGSFNESYGFNVESSTEPVFKLTSDNKWVKFESESEHVEGQHYKKYKITISADNYFVQGEQRTCGLTVTSENTDLMEEYTITQNPFVFDVNFMHNYSSVSSVSLAALEGDEVKITAEAKCSSDLSISESDEGEIVSYESFGGTPGRNNTRTAEIKIAPNYSTSEKTATITVSSEFYDANDSVRESLTKQLTIKRAGYKFTASADIGSQYDFSSAKEGNKEFTFDCSGNDVKVDYAPSTGLTASVEKVSEGIWKLKLEVEENKENTSREWTVTVNANDASGLSHTFKVTQKGTEE